MNRSEIGLIIAAGLVAFVVTASMAFAMDATLRLIHPDCLPHVTHGAVIHCERF